MPPDAIATELTQLAAFYGHEAELRRVIAGVDLSHYVEIVLHESGFELVTGGVEREAALVAEARALHCPAAVIDAFQQGAAHFPHKMGYGKVAIGPNPARATLYLGLVEPWAVVLPFLRTLPALAPAALDALSAQMSARRICTMLAFSLQAAELVVKSYQLAPRPAGTPAHAPFLIAHRLRAGQAQPTQKLYTAGVTWDDLPTDGRWPAIAQVGRALFGDAYALVRGDVTADDGVAADGDGVKLYVFRYDQRENSSYTLKTFNYYAEEAVRLYQVGQPDEAVAALTEALRFGRGDEARLYNMRGLVHYSRRHFQPAAADFEAATRLDETLAQAHNNLAAALLQLGDYEAAIYAASRALFLDPHSDMTNLNAAKRLLRESELVA